MLLRQLYNDNDGVIKLLQHIILHVLNGSGSQPPGLLSIFSARDLKCKCTESLKYTVSYCRGLLILSKFHKSMFGRDREEVGLLFLLILTHSILKESCSCEASG